MLIRNYKTGYPLDFLIARINNRADILLTTINYLKKSPEMLSDFDWKKFNLTFRKELINIYFLIEEKKRDILKNIFLIFEVTNILSLIRLSYYENKNLIKGIILNSLLKKEISNIFLKTEIFEKKLKYLMFLFAEINRDLINLVDIFKNEGLKVFEEKFLKLFFEGILKDKKNIEEVEYFIKNFIDYININSIWKKIFWNSQINSLFIEGGFLSINKIEEMFKNNQKNTSLSYLKKIMLDLQKKRFISDYYLIIYYITSLYVENINLNILSNTIGLIDREYENYLI